MTLSATATANDQPDLLDAIDQAASKLAAAREAVGSVIYGQKDVIEHSLTTLLAGGHMLLIGMPGLAKTRLVTTLSKVMGLDSRRIQCTPDLMPSDILGAEVLEEMDYGKRQFRFIQGPVFTQFLMVDEINRASPRTQSALLQAMQEHRVSVAGHERDLPTPFHVLATQNPIEQEGTYPLPEAQLDRFLLQIDMDYPSLEAERQMMINTMSVSEPAPPTLIYAADLRAMQQLVRRMPLSEKVLEGILALVRNGRPETSKLDAVKRHVLWGPGPRASQAFGLAARARALLDGRLAPSLDDVVALAKPVLQHRMAISYASRAEGIQVDDILKTLTQSAANL